MELEINNKLKDKLNKYKPEVQIIGFKALELAMEGKSSDSIADRLEGELRSLSQIKKDK